MDFVLYPYTVIREAFLFFSGGNFCRHHHKTDNTHKDAKI